MSVLMMKAAHTSETSVYNYFTRLYIPEDKSELQHFRYSRLRILSLSEIISSNNAVIIVVPCEYISSLRVLLLVFWIKYIDNVWNSLSPVIAQTADLTSSCRWNACDSLLGCNAKWTWSWGQYIPPKRRYLPTCPLTLSSTTKKTCIGILYMFLSNYK
jgi:hypothetical protein